MIRPRDKAEGDRLREALKSWPDLDNLEGLNEDTLEVLIEQIIESTRRNRFFEYLLQADLRATSKDPHTDRFDPLRAAILLQREDEIDEAFWMVFLYTHFGKNRRSGYGYARDVYGRLGTNPLWSWAQTSQNLDHFREWLQDNKKAIRDRHRPGGFGNHRKYESLDGWSYAGTGSVVESYVDWIGPEGHRARIDEAQRSGGESCFDWLYQSLDTVHRFGRTARFDYLMTAFKVGLTSCRPTHAHLRGATGPVRGVKLLVTGQPDGNLSPRDQDGALASVEARVNVGYDVLEDALCNWQKSPARFEPFRG